MSKTRGGPRTRDLTRGPILRDVVLFSVPLFVTSLIQLLYGTVDLIFVGNFIGADATAAVGSSTLIVAFVLGFFTGLGIGVGTVIAIQFGTGHDAQLELSLHTAIGMALLSGVVLTPVLILLSNPCLVLINTPAEIIGMAGHYLRIYLCGLISIVVYNIGAGVLRALGDPRTPMLCQLVGGIMNVLADALFICAFSLGVTGAACATLVSQTLSAVLVLRALCKLQTPYQLQFRRIRIHHEPAVQMLRIGIPSGIQAMVITLSNLIVQYFINSLGVTDIAAFAVYFKVENLIYLPILAIGQTTMTFVSQNVGAGKVPHAHRGVRICLVLGAAVTMILSAMLVTFCPQVFGFFTGDVNVIRVGTAIGIVNFSLYAIYVVIEVLSGAMRGIGNSLAPMVLVLVTICGMRIALLTIFPQFFNSAMHVALVYPITWAAAALCLTVYYLSGNRKYWNLTMLR